MKKIFYVRLKYNLSKKIFYEKEKYFNKQRKIFYERHLLSNMFKENTYRKCVLRKKIVSERNKDDFMTGKYKEKYFKND